MDNIESIKYAIMQDLEEFKSELQKQLWDRFVKMYIKKAKELIEEGKLDFEDLGNGRYTLFGGRSVKKVLDAMREEIKNGGDNG